MSARLDVLDVHTWETLESGDTKWAACLGEYDCGTPIFTGPTQRMAIEELLDYYEQNNGELHK